MINKSNMCFWPFSTDISPSYHSNIYTFNWGIVNINDKYHMAIERDSISTMYNLVEDKMSVESSDFFTPMLGCFDEQIEISNRWLTKFFDRMPTEEIDGLCSLQEAIVSTTRITYSNRDDRVVFSCHWLPLVLTNGSRYAVFQKTTISTLMSLSDVRFILVFSDIFQFLTRI